MENAVDLIDLFYALQINLEGTLNDIYSEIYPEIPNDNRWLNLYEASKSVLLDIRISEKVPLTNHTLQLEKSLSECKEIQNKVFDQTALNLISKIIKSNEHIVNLSHELLSSPQVSNEYLLYGPYYYYYNVKMIENFNRYGNGFVVFLNKLIETKNFNSLLKMELPHYFKVIYPKRKEKKIDAIASKLSNIASLPENLEGREVKKASVGTIIADSSSLKIQLYDNKIQDGDIVSINFNGDWIFNNISLETKPKEFELNLNKSGRNYIILHAVNVGRRPPNTIGLSYTYKGKKETIVLQSDMNTSELVEIKMDH